MTKLDHLAMRLVIATTLLVPTCLPAFAQETPQTDEAARGGVSEDVEQAKREFARAMSEIDRLKGVLVNSKEILEVADSFTQSLSHAESRIQELRQSCSDFDIQFNLTSVELRHLVAPQVEHCRGSLARHEHILASAPSKLREISAGVEKIKQLMATTEAGIKNEEDEAESSRIEIDMMTSMRTWDSRLKRDFKSPGS